MSVLLVVLALVSTAVAVTMTGVAWRVVRDERVRSDARIAALAADIHRRDVDEVPFVADMTPAASASAAGMFRARDAARPTGTAIGAGVAAIGAMVILVLVLTGGSRGTSAARTSDSLPHADPVPTEPRASAVATKPLELIALSHERDADRLIVRGVVRNPSSGGTIDRLTAVVSLFDRDGELIGTDRAAVDAVTLAPGGETTFALTLPRAGDVSRYRVSFRTGQGVLAHVDRRP